MVCVYSKSKAVAIWRAHFILQIPFFSTPHNTHWKHRLIKAVKYNNEWMKKKNCLIKERNETPTQYLIYINFIS